MTNQTKAVWLRVGVQGGAILLGFGAVGTLTVGFTDRPDRLALDLMLLVMAATLTRRYGLPLPGRGFASFVVGVAWFALFARGWSFAVVATAVGTAAGDLLFRRLSLRAALINVGHIVTALGLTGLAYSNIGGAYGAGALASDNLLPVVFALVILPIVLNATFYYEQRLATGLAWLDARTTLAWEGLVALASAGLALGWLALTTSPGSPLQIVAGGVGLLAGTVAAHYVFLRAVRADELLLIQRISGAVATDVSIERSFRRIQEITHRIVPWEQMGFARYHDTAHELELVADTGTTERLRLPASGGLTGEAVRRGGPVVASANAGLDMIVPEGEQPGSEVLIPLYHGDRLVGMWSVRHTDPGLYRDADGEVLNLLAPQLALSLALSELLSPMAKASEQAAQFVHDLASSSGTLAMANDAANDSARQAESGAKRAAELVESAATALKRLVEEIETAAATGDEAGATTQKMSQTAFGLKDSSGRAVQQFTELADTLEVSASEVSQLREAATEVEGFSETIANIANQTNLLALNATIEAARAGVHGRGFAVVADEVRKLAEESARAARSIGRSAQNTRAVIDSAARLLEQIRDRLTDLAASSESLREELNTIAEQADESRRAGERFAALPKNNLARANEARGILSEALDAATSSAHDAGGVTGSINDQAQAVRELNQAASKLSALAKTLESGAGFVETEPSSG